MNCEHCEPSIIEYVLDELNECESADILAHIETCAYCRSLCESYACLVDTIACEPESHPTSAQSESLSRALARIDLPVKQTMPVGQPVAQGLLAMILGSMLAFVLIATVLTLQVLGSIDIVGAIWSHGPAPTIVFVAIAIFVTSFLPIAMTSKRRPLNGMTFRR
ncbi:MAG: hypothetical protein ABFD49_00920 [Armatimonadota bacterium]|nr:hypothetical protein [bacterium]